jgi:hypothetical protein
MSFDPIMVTETVTVSGRPDKAMSRKPGDLP